MHERLDFETYLKDKAEAIRDDIEETHGFGSPPVIILVPGTSEGPPRTSLASVGLDRLRDLLGTLTTATQIESLKHLGRSP